MKAEMKFAQDYVATLNLKTPPAKPNLNVDARRKFSTMPIHDFNRKA